ncbi:MAG: ATP-binding protein [Actinomycetota bacterium]|nr:ATP-binding protein [Actinomycetota bacterium]
MDRATADDSVEVVLPNDATAALRARHAVRSTLTRWRLPHLIDACMLAVSELVTNALRHGSPPISVLLRRHQRDVRLDVHDGDPLSFSARHPGDETDLRESGRGLDIVRAVADESGLERVEGDGKTAFATWHVDTKSD